MILFAAAIKILSTAVKSLGEMDWDDMAKGLVGVGVLLAEVETPPIAIRPFAISEPLILPKSDIADANIFIAAAISIKARPVEITCLASPVSLVNAVISSRSAAIDVRPLVISPR